MSKKTVEEIYQKKTQLEHILLRPDTYIGSTQPQTTPLWVYQDSQMIHKPIQFVPGLYKIFDEIIVNAADNKVRDPSMNAIKVTIDRENNEFSVYNNGQGIPVRMHEKEKVYVPELIFGHLLTSSNYDDNEQKITGGRNGYGAKLCNIFSEKFVVETADSESGLKFKQTFTKNMSKKTEPQITSNPKKEEYTKITFKPDLAKFGLDTIDDDFHALFVKRVYDLAGCVRGIKVYLNGEHIKIRNFQEYVNLYLDKTNSETGTKLPIIYERLNERWEVCFTLSDGQFNQVSFVNSICTIKGGTHVNAVADQIVTALIEAVKKKDKKGIPLKPFQAKNHLWLFVNSAIVNPTFDSQTKETMTLKASAFGSKPVLGEDFMKKVMKSGVVENVLSYAKFKQDQLMKKTDGSGKRSRISGLTKLDDANNAGTKNASKCTLILTEGDSAKSLAVSGLSVVGRDNFGVFPLRGKLLNVRDATHAQIMANAEISAIKQILGLQQGKVYTDASSLRYGHLMIMTDQDYDGSHIKGLIINFIDHFWPSLLKVPGFLLEFITPIVKATKGKNAQKKEISFFTIPEYEAWKEANDNGKGWVLKYYKGLGTSTTEDAKKYFSDLGKHLKPFQASDENCRELIDMAFNKKKADGRKEWLRGFQSGTFMDHSIDEIPLDEFINKELILFSMADNIRSIPSAVDGLKPGQRKVLFSCFKRNLKAEIKVAQLGGYVAEQSAYHHGEASLYMTIVNMAQNYVGSNNLNLLEPLGQFGTRLQGGKDAASPRYIFTNLSTLARTIFHPHDDPLLNYLNDDGQSIEPEWYMPVVPMLLINGGEGIGTGWSTAIPNYNPTDIIDNINRHLNGEDMIDMQPWYRGFQGLIEKETESRYKISGIINQIDETTVEITELPLKSWTQTYKEQLEQWVTGTDKTPAWIKDYKEYHTDSKVHFVISLTPENMEKALKEGLEQKFKLTTTISTSNLVCHDLEGRIKKYSTVLEILKDFCQLREKYYHKRKDYLLGELTADHMKIENRVRFVTEIIEGKLIVQNRKKSDLLQELKDRNYDPIFKKSGGEEGEESGANGGYDYLLSMPIWNLTWEKVQNLIKEKQQKETEIKILLEETSITLWKADLNEFQNQWNKFESELAEFEAQGPDNSTYAGGKKAKGKKKTVDEMNKKKKKASMDSDDESEDFAPVKKKAEPKKKAEVKKPSILDLELAKPAPVKKEAVKKAPPKKKAVAVDTESEASDIDDMSLSEDEKPQKKTAKPKVVKEVVLDEDSKSKKKPAPKKKAAKIESDSEVESDFDGMSMSDDEPPKKATKAKTIKPVVLSESDDDMPKAKVVDSEDEFSYMEVVVPKTKAKPKAKASSGDADKLVKPKKTTKSKKPAVSDDEESDQVKKPKLKQTTIQFPKITSKRSSPTQEESAHKKRLLNTKKVAIPGVKPKSKKKEKAFVISDESDADATINDLSDEEVGPVEPKSFPKRAPKKTNYRVDDSFMEDEDDDDFDLSE